MAGRGSRKEIEISMTSEEPVRGVKCLRCGTVYSQYKGNFPTTLSEMYIYNGYIPVCNRCVDKIFKGYLAECGDEQAAVRQTCRYLNLFYSDDVFKSSLRISGDKSRIFKYLSKLKSLGHDSKNYDDTLRMEGAMWSCLRREAYTEPGQEAVSEPAPEPAPEPEEPIPDEWIKFWGPGQPRGEYEWLQDRYEYYLSRLDSPTIDVGKELLIKQICNLESDINKGKADGKSVEKSVAGLNNLLGSLEWKPSQSKDDDSYDKNPLGVWIKKYEDQRPLPEIDPELEDVDHIIHYVSTFFMGHLAKMVGLKNRYSKMYEDEMKKYTIQAPVLDDDTDDDITFSELFEDWQED